MKFRARIKPSSKSKTWLSSKKTTFTWVMLGFFVISTVVFTIQTATSGAKLSWLETEEAKIFEENQDLKRELVLLNSLSNLGEGAEDLGFTKPQKIMYISEDETVAKVP